MELPHVHDESTRAGDADEDTAGRRGRAADSAATSEEPSSSPRRRRHRHRRKKSSQGRRPHSGRRRRRRKEQQHVQQHAGERGHEDDEDGGGGGVGEDDERDYKVTNDGAPVFEEEEASASARGARVRVRGRGVKVAPLVLPGVANVSVGGDDEDEDEDDDDDDEPFNTHSARPRPSASGKAAGGVDSALRKRTNAIVREAVRRLGSYRTHPERDIFAGFQTYQDRVKEYRRSIIFRANLDASDKIVLAADAKERSSPLFVKLRHVRRLIDRGQAHARINGREVREAINERFTIRLSDEQFETLVETAMEWAMDPDTSSIPTEIVDRILMAMDMAWYPELTKPSHLAHCYGLAYRPETEVLLRIALSRLLVLNRKVPRQRNPVMNKQDVEEEKARIRQYRMESRRIFMNFDRDGSGTIGPREMSYVLFALNIRLSPKGLSLLQMAGCNMRGKVTMREFENIFRALRTATVYDSYAPKDTEGLDAWTLEGQLQYEDEETSNLSGAFEYLFFDMKPLEAGHRPDGVRALVDDRFIAEALQDNKLQADAEVSAMVAKLGHWLLLPVAYARQQWNELWWPEYSVKDLPPWWQRMSMALLKWTFVTAMYAAVPYCTYWYKQAEPDELSFLEGMGPAILYMLWMIIDVTTDLSHSGASRQWRLRLRQGYLRKHCRVVVIHYDTCAEQEMDSWPIFKQLSTTEPEDRLSATDSDLSLQRSAEGMRFRANARRKSIVVQHAIVIFGSAAHALSPSLTRLALGETPFGSELAFSMTIISSAIFQFIMAFAILAVLITIVERLARYSHSVQQFSALVERRASIVYFKFWLNFNHAANVIGWSRMRAYLMESRSTPIRRLEQFLGWCVVILFVLALYFVVNGLAFELEVTPTFVTFLLDTIVLTTLLMIIVGLGARVNDLLGSHARMLNKFQFKLQLSLTEQDDEEPATSRKSALDRQISQHNDHSEKAASLTLIDSLIRLLKESDEPLQILGVVMSTEFVNTIAAGMATVLLSAVQSYVKS